MLMVNAAATVALTKTMRVFADAGPELPQLPRITKGTLAGIVVAISGNIIISLALNCQKLAHKRLEQKREARARELESYSTSSASDSDSLSTGHIDLERRRVNDLAPGGVSSGSSLDSPAELVTLVETDPLLESPTSSTSYGSASAKISRKQQGKRKLHLLSKLLASRKDNEDVIHETDTAHSATTHAPTPVDVIPVRFGSVSSLHKESSDEVWGNESDYLKSKLWWLGFLLMNIGELGNFISYAFAPASVVAPLGTFALIANCIFAPVMLKERFVKQDFLGIIIATIGAVTVVLSSNSSDVQLDTKGLLHAITQRPFLAYAGIYIGGAVILSWLSQGELGKRWVYVDVGLCALFGGFTVLSTKAISTLLTREWFDVFTEWITYPVIAVLIGTGIGQIRYLNRALMRFDSKLVVPTQFVLFNLSAIIGSAILYGDFIKATFHQIMTFLYGCAATFAGVFIIAWAPSGLDEPSEVEGAEDDELLPDVDEGPTRSRSGSVARRNRAKPVISESTTASPALRYRHSIVGMYGLSPAQRVLLLNPSPRDEIHPHLHDPESQLSSTPDSVRRRRAISWLGDDGGHGGWRSATIPIAGTRESSRNSFAQRE